MPGDRDVVYMMKPELSDYDYEKGHLMKPFRLAVTNNLVLNYNLHRYMDIYEPLPASKEQLQVFHTPEYIDYLDKISPLGKVMKVDCKDGDNPFGISPHSDCPPFQGLLNYVLHYTGGSLDAARKLGDGRCEVAINWSGGLHHARKGSASGFCYANDIVIAVLELLKYFHRVLYVDIDVHHGDGVEEAFYSTNRVMTLSFHHFGDRFFPETGSYKANGIGEGKNYSINAPFKAGISTEQYHDVFKFTIRRIMESFRPDCLVVQCGADSLASDLLGTFNLSLDGHAECLKYMRSFDLPTLVLGGGGYNVTNVARCWTNETSVLVNQEIEDDLPYCEYFEQFFPTFKLRPELHHKFKNANTPRYLGSVKFWIDKVLRELEAAPSVQMHDAPPSFQDAEDEKKKRDEKEDAGKDKRTRKHRK